MEEANVQLVQRGYEALAMRDFDAIGQLLDDDVRWHGADDEDPHCGCRSRRDVLSFIRNALAQGVTVELLDVRQAGDYVLAVLQASRQDEDEPLAPHAELVSIRDGKIIAIIVYENAEQALNAAA